jgi:hypothetical protein
MEGAEESFAPDHTTVSSSRCKAAEAAPKINGVIEDIEMMGDFTTQEENIGVEKAEDGHDGKMGGRESEARLAALHGINRPFFHPDLQSALTSAIATEKLHAAIGNESPGGHGMVERLEVEGQSGEK